VWNPKLAAGALDLKVVADIIEDVVLVDAASTGHVCDAAVVLEQDILLSAFVIFNW
jgi:hypothetical protein